MQGSAATDLRRGGSFKIISEFNSEKNNENWPTFAEVIVNIKLSTF